MERHLPEDRRSRDQDGDARRIWGDGVVGLHLLQDVENDTDSTDQIYGLS